MKVIAFTGMPFSGKTEAVEIAKNMGIPVVRMGDSVWGEVRKRGLKLNDENVGKIADEMRKKHGKEIWARRTLEKIKSKENKRSIVIDGIRNIEEIEVFKKGLGQDFVVIAVEASSETRKKRAFGRDRIDDSKDINLIKKRDQRELSWGLGLVIASADIVASNEGNIDEFRKEIKKILAEI
jgi:dephospho-CoA kinase